MQVLRGLFLAGSIQRPDTGAAPAGSAWTLADTAAVSMAAALAMLLRYAAIRAVPLELASDGLAYWDIANAVASGDGITWGGAPTAFYNVGYPLFLGAVLRVFGQSVGVAQFLNVALGGISAAFLYVATWKLFGSRLAATAAALLFATYSESIIFATYLLKENLMTALVAAQLAAAACFAPGTPPRTRTLLALALGATIGALMLVGNSSLAFLPGLAVWGFRRSPGFGRLARDGAVAAVVAALVVAPVVYRNYVVFGAPVLNNNFGNNLYVGNFPGASPTFPENFPVGTPMEKDFKRLYTELGEFKMDRHLRDLAIGYIAADPAAALTRMAVKAVVFWQPPIPTAAKLASKGEAVMRFVWLAQFLVMVGLFLFALTRWRRFSTQFTVLCLLLFCYTLIHTPFTVGSRYRLPAMLFVMAGASVGALPILQKLAGRFRITAISA